MSWLTEGQHEPTARHARPTAPEDDKTTAFNVAPVMKPIPPRPEPEVESEVVPRVMLLGGGESSRELAIALQGLGAEVIAVDGYAGAPAHRVADQSVVVAMTDAEELTAVIRRLRPDFAVTVDDAVSPAALAGVGSQADSEFTELVPNARSVRLVADREGLRRLAADQLGLPTAPFWFVGSLGELEAVAAHAGFPLLVKPVAGGQGGQGSSVVAGPGEVEAAWQRAVAPQAEPEAGGAGPRVWAESVVEVEFLVTMIVVCRDGPTGPVMEFCAPIGHRDADAGGLESWQPQQMSTAARDAARSIAARIVKALGGRGVYCVELMINGDEVYFADVTVCPAESAWVTVRSQRLSVFELQARATLGLAVDTMMISPGAARMMNPSRTAGRASIGVPDAEALTHALGVPESDVRVFGRGLGVALATAPELATARDRAREVASRLNVRDSRG
ncbi:formate-dependent phosphoribosylglycinamide formyltransferase [Mycobacterium decipiens]|uniref:Phosphoribosylglycinamide formyltransferase 2 n=1 Tax=Mycobacterium decipiens TaxID=1430326 RepID=A0A1X2LZM5_9MYCO|nr:formate-dependent phosphoribosylglycinamide formyltransferase [Mycobacterium decipiens]OSC42722.1 phosphoribosylglycinamide formyltransferase 2 [Mycobacterium decipiens]